MRREWMRKSAVCALVIGLCATAVRAAEETPIPAPEEAVKDWAARLDLSYSTKYVWRGIVIVDAPVAQGTAAFSWKGLTLSAWGNMDITRENRYPGHGDSSGDVTEVDLTADYSFEWRMFNFSVGVINYQFPNTAFDTTTEVYGAVGLNAPLSPRLTVYHDVDEANGTYAALSAGHRFENVVEPLPNVSVSADLAASVGAGSSKCNRFYYGHRHAGLTDAKVTAGLPIRFGEYATVTPSVSYSSLLDGGIRRGVRKDDNVWVAVTVAFDF